LKHFNIDPILWGTLMAFLSPPVAMSAFYLKGVSPPHVTLNQIFAGMILYMLVIILCKRNIRQCRPFIDHGCRGAALGNAKASDQAEWQEPDRGLATPSHVQPL
jgi:hypothetical protein